MGLFSFFKKSDNSKESANNSSVNTKVATNRSMSTPPPANNLNSNLNSQSNSQVNSGVKANASSSVPPVPSIKALAESVNANSDLGNMADNSLDELSKLVASSGSNRANVGTQNPVLPNLNNVASSNASQGLKNSLPRRSASMPQQSNQTLGTLHSQGLSADSRNSINSPQLSSQFSSQMSSQASAQTSSQASSLSSPQTSQLGLSSNSNPFENSAQGNDDILKHVYHENSILFVERSYFFGLVSDLETLSSDISSLKELIQIKVNSDDFMEKFQNLSDLVEDINRNALLIEKKIFER